ncbi:MAG: hypothetical protein R2752_10970 [Vicinamibacterales bacterium]
MTRLLRRLSGAGLGLILLFVGSAPAAWRDPGTAATRQAAASDLDRLLTEYRHGDAGAALAALAGWDPARLEAAISAGRDRDRAPWDAAALALLHSEAAARRDADAGRAASLTEARRLMTDVACHPDAAGADAALRRVCRDWYVQMVGEYFDLYRTDDRFSPGDPLVLMARAAYAERRMGPVEERNHTGEDLIGLTPTSHGRFNTYADDAVHLLRKALDADPSLVEARVRLGHVLYQLDRTGDARAELADAIARARDAERPDQAYLAHLFLARIAEEAGRADEALAAYDAAIAVAPHHPAASLAAARLRAGAGDLATAVTLAAAPLTSPGDDGFGDLDPWTLYPYGSWGSDRPAALARLREAVRR